MSSARAVVAGHGDFAQGLVSAVDQITGQGARFVTLSNRDAGAGELEARLRALVRDEGVLVIFTDLPAGSCTMAARRLQREHPDLRLVTGANVPVLLDFACGPGTDLAGCAERGRAAIGVAAPPGGTRGP